MLSRLDLASDQPQVYVCKNDKTEREWLDLLQWQGQKLAHFNQNYSHPKARLAHLCSRYLLETLGLEIEKNATGKPFLSDNSQQIAISHNHTYAVLSLYHKPVGVDVEEISPRFERIKHKFVDKHSLAYAKSLGIEQQKLFFSQYWAGKEAVYKISGQSLSDYAEMITIKPFIPEKNAQTLAYLEKSGTFAPYKLIFLHLGCNHLVAVAY